MTFEPAKHEKEAWQETAGRYGFPRICLPFERVVMSLFV